MYEDFAYLARNVSSNNGLLPLAGCQALPLPVLPGTSSTTTKYHYQYYQVLPAQANQAGLGPDEAPV